MKVIVGISKRHVHLSEEVYEKLFGNTNIEVRNPLRQPGQYASTSTVDIKCNDIVIEHVRVVGPIRKYSQVEVSESDAELFGVKPPRRKSGDLAGSLPITIIGPLGEVTLNEGLILAEAHVHLSPELACELNFEDNEILDIYKNNQKVMEAKAKVEPNGFPELHIDNDEENIYDVHQDEEVEIRKSGA